MELQHFTLKLPVAEPAELSLDAFIPIFHQWIREPPGEELLIDVADYRHVPGGPGMILIGLQADYAMDAGGNQLGLLYRRKATQDGSNRERLLSAIDALHRASERLENDPLLEGRLSFDRHRLEITVGDRLLAPNRRETYEKVRPELAACFAEHRGEVTLHYDTEGDPRGLFSVSVAGALPLLAQGRIS